MPVAIINETMARRFFPAVDPVGRRIRLSGDDTAWMTIVGLVSDIRDQSLDDPPRPMYYLVQSQMPVTSRGPYSNMTLIVPLAAYENASSILSPYASIYASVMWSRYVYPPANKVYFSSTLLYLIAKSK